MKNLFSRNPQGFAAIISASEHPVARRSVTVVAMSPVARRSGEIVTRLYSSAPISDLETILRGGLF